MFGNNLIKLIINMKTDKYCFVVSGQFANVDSDNQHMQQQKFHF